MCKIKNRWVKFRIKNITDAKSNNLVFFSLQNMEDWCVDTDVNDEDLSSFPHTEENAEYRKQVIENIKGLLLDHPNGIFDRNFNDLYRDAFGETIDFQELGYPAHKSNKSKFLESLTGSILKMEYSTPGLYIKPSKLLLSEIDESRIESLSLLDAQELQDEDLQNQSVHGVRKQVRKV